MAQEQTKHAGGGDEDETENVDASAKAGQSQREKLAQVGEDVDELCKDIDDVLCDVNAADFVRGYVQKGGQ